MNEHWSGVRWCAESRNLPTRHSCRTDLTVVSTSLDDPTVLSHVQTTAGLSASAEHEKEWRGDSGLLRHYRVHADPDSYRPHTDEANVRDDLLLP